MARPKIKRPTGRPTAVVANRRQELLDEARQRGVEPIMVMFEAMQHFLERSKAAENAGEQDQLILQAVDIARSAAPYCHPKLGQLEVSGPDGGPMQMMGVLAHLSDDELAERAALRLSRPKLKLIEGKAD